MTKCPVCEFETGEGIPEKCSQCAWELKSDLILSRKSSEVDNTMLKKYYDDLLNYKQMWMIKKHLYAQKREELEQFFKKIDMFIDKEIESFKINLKKDIDFQLQHILINNMQNTHENIKKYDYTDMAIVEGGTFMMGSDSEYESHTVTIDSFLMGKFQITQKIWTDIMGINPSSEKGENLPVSNVSWYDALEFCNMLSIRSGLEPCYIVINRYALCDFTKNGYRLPTEAEWEYAARGGNLSKGYQFSGSNELKEVAFYSSNSKNIKEVGQKKENELGIYDMTGNVWEWCWDSYEKYQKEAVENPRYSDGFYERVLRGGSYRNKSYYCQVSARNNADPDNKRNDNGFRIAKSLKHV